MDGNTWGWVIKPDQLQVINPLLVLAFIPIFDRGIYPLLATCGMLKSPLQRLTMGGIFAGIAFAISGLVELSLEATYATELKSGESNIHLINGLSGCPLYVTLAGQQIIIQPNEMHIYEAIKAADYLDVIFETFDGDGACQFSEKYIEPVIHAESEVAKSYMALWNKSGKIKLHHIEDEDDMEKAKSGNPRVRVIYDPENLKPNTIIQGHTETQSFQFNLDSDGDGWTSFGEVEPKKYDLYLSNNDNPLGFKFPDELDMKLGAVYVMSVVRNEQRNSESPAGYEIVLHQITKANDVHMLLLIPQFLIMTMGEIMFSITIMDFSYAEGPPSMKAVMQSAWLMTVAFGNLIVVIIAELQIFDKQWKEFFLFAGLMFLDMVVFAYMAYKYEPTDRFWLKDNEVKENSDEDRSENKRISGAGGEDNLALEYKED
jgi:solute carrier family 15 oligopeptide transporter 1